MTTTGAFALATAYALIGFAVAEAFDLFERRRGADLGSGYLVFFLLWPFVVIMIALATINSRRK